MDERSAVITLTTTGGGPAASATVTITQGPAPNAPTLGLTSHTSGDTVNISHYDAATMTDIAFMVGGNATGWTSNIVYTPDGADFIGLDVASNVAERGSVTVTATPTGINSGIERSATITISTSGPGTSPAAVTLTITQAGAPPTLTLTSDVGETIAYDAESASDITFEVGGGATGWEATVDEGFVTLDKTMGSSGSATLKVAVTENVGVERSVVITFTTMGGTGAPASATVTIRQAGIPPVYVGDITLINQEQVDTIRNTLGSSTAIRGHPHHRTFHRH